MLVSAISRTVTRSLAAAALAVATLGSAHALTVSLDMNSGGWVSNYDATSLDPRVNYGLVPYIETSGANFEAANTGWQNLGYNDSGWAAYAGGWVPGDGSHSPMYLRKTFTLGTPTGGNFYLEVDDDSIVWINGVIVPGLYDASHGYDGGHSADITSFLQAGDNVIAIKADNSPGGGYYIGFAGFAQSDAITANVPEPGTFALLGLGLLGAGLARRRRA